MRRGVTTRSVVIGALLIPVNAYWIVRLERVLFGPYTSTISLFANVVFALFVFVGVNRLLRRVAPGLALAQGELLTVYTMLAISTGIAGLDGVGILSQMMPHGAWFGPGNHWDKLVAAFPDWLVVRDRDVLRGHFLGNSSFYRPAVVRAWATPILAWTLFITVLLFVAQCLNVLVLRQWSDSERLTFPIVWLPLEMTDGGMGTSYFANRLMWAGFALAAGLNLWNGIAFLNPALPALPIGITDLKPLLATKPWSAIDWLPVTLYPLAIGLGFLLPLDLLFSCWFFYLFWKGQMVVSNAMGWDVTPDFPFIIEQGFGGLMGLFCFYAWGAIRSRRYGRDRSRQPLSPRARDDTSAERRAAIGAAAGLVVLFVFCSAARVAWWVTLVFFAVYLASILVVTRIRAEFGSPVHDFHFMGPDAMLPRAIGTASLRPADMAFFTFDFALTRAHRSDTMPVGLEGLYMARTRRLESGRMFRAIMLATALGTLSAFWAFEHQAYQLGAAAKFEQGFGHAQQAFDRMSKWMAGTQNARGNPQAVGAMAVGLMTALALAACRVRWYGFPLHPIGYAVSSSWAINLVWLPLLIAWALKALTLRYGGLPAYRRFVPFFLGLILGDCVMGSFWALISLVLNMRTYNFFGA